ncbi:hypothetical protein PENTCL1PPCAC_12352, partial [Pristionchus entomophagus]
NQLITLSKQRTDALMIGDMNKADSIRARMFQIKDDAVRNNYMDLITDENQVRAYGIESKWTKKRNDVDPKPVMLRAPSPICHAPSPVHHHSAPPEERARSAERKTSANMHRLRSAARSPEGNIAPPTERRRSPPQ